MPFWSLEHPYFKAVFFKILNFGAILQNLVFSEEDLFQEHAVRNHPLSCVFFAEKLFEDQPTLEQPVVVEVTTEKGLGLETAIFRVLV